MRKVAWATAVVTLLAVGGPGAAIAGEQILRCKGTAERGDAHAQTFWRYYWIEGRSWSYYDKNSRGWTGDKCRISKAICATSADSHHLNFRSPWDGLEMDVKIDRRSGEVLDVSKQAGVTITFQGRCKPSEDPIPPPGRKY